MNQCDLFDRKKYTYLKIKRLQHVKDSEHKHEDIEISSTILKGWAVAGACIPNPWDESERRDWK